MMLWFLAIVLLFQLVSELGFPKAWQIQPFVVLSNLCVCDVLLPLLI